MARTMNQLRMGWIVLTAAGIATAAIAWSPLHAQMMGGGIGGPGMAGGGGPGMAGGGGGFTGEGGGGAYGMGGGAGMPGMGGGGMGMGMIMEDEPVVTWTKPVGPQPDWLERGKKALAAKEKIRRQLDQQAEVDFNNIPLSVALKETLADKTGIPFHLDPRGLEQAAKTPEEPITLSTRGTLRDVLNRILQPAGLEYIVLEDGIEITSQPTAEIRGAILAYDLSHFARDNREGKKIMMLIETMLSPERWSGSGGSATCQLIGSVLYVKASESLHCEIEQFLAHFARIDEQTYGPIYGPSTLPEPSTLGQPQLERIRP